MPYKNPEDQKRNIKRWTEENHAHKLDYMKRYRTDNLEAVNAANKKWRQENPERCAVNARSWAARNKEKVVGIKQAFAERHKERLKIKAREYQVRRRETDENFKILGVLRCRLYAAIKKAGGKKVARTMALVGCDIEFLRGWLEGHFLPGMTWKNHGKWHVDHHIPCAEFDLRVPEQQRQCFHYKNLRPLWGIDNLRKSNKRPPTHQAELL